MTSIRRRREFPIQVFGVYFHAPMLAGGSIVMAGTIGGWLNSSSRYAGRGRRWTASRVYGLSEHRMVVRRALRHGLQDIPVFDDLAVLQAEEVRCGGAPSTRV
jgi:hypothetical protein